VARRDVSALPASERRGARPEHHAYRRLVYRDRWQRLRVGCVGYGFPDLGALDAREGNDVAGADLIDLDALEPEVREARVSDIAERLRLERLVTFFDRLAVPSA